MKGVLLWFVHWACHAGAKDFCLTLAALVGPVENIFFLTVYYFYSVVPSPCKLGRQTCWVACFSVCVSGDRSIRNLTLVLNCAL
jgi:hypothetical protein